MAVFFLKMDGITPENMHINIPMIIKLKGMSIKQSKKRVEHG